MLDGEFYVVGDDFVDFFIYVFSYIRLRYAIGNDNLGTADHIPQITALWYCIPHCVEYLKTFM